MSSTIPLVDLAAAHAEIADEVAAGFARVIGRTAFIGGEDVGAFEREYAAFSAAAHCVGVANGTDAIELALRAHGVGPGDEVITAANTFIATVGAIARTGATPVLVDCDPDTYLIDTDAALDAVTARTRAIVPVHLYGQLAPVERLHEGLAALDRDGGDPDRAVVIIEDGAQSQGATRHGRPSGHGTTVATSFYPGKNLGAYGDAGAVTTDDDTVAAAIRALGNHGGTAKYRHDMPGMNSRLDTLQAVVLRAKLPRLPAWNAARRAAADRYHALLADVPGVVLPTVLDGNEHVWHLYVVRVPHRDAVLEKLHADGIGAGIHYPHAVHQTAAFADLADRDRALPHAEQAAAEILSLPLHPHLTADQQERVAASLRAAVG